MQRTVIASDFYDDIHLVTAGKDGLILIRSDDAGRFTFSNLDTQSPGE